MRIAVMSMYSGVVHRGVEAWAADLCRHLGHLGHECLLIAGGPAERQAAEYETVSVEYVCPDRSGDAITGRLQTHLHRHGLDTRTRELFGFAVRCVPPLRTYRPDVIIPTNGQLSIAAAALYRCLFNAETRIVVVAHAGFDRTLQRAARLGADGLIALEPSVLHRVHESGTSPAGLIPDGVDCGRFEGADPIPLDLPRPIVLTTAALVPYKRLHLVIEAVAEAGFSLLMMGDGPLRAELTALGHERLGLQRFRHLPAVPAAHMPGYYAAADVFTLPSEASEVFAISIVEALASGVPTVIPDDPIRRWIAGESAIFVDPSDRLAYVEALRRAAGMSRTLDVSDVRRRFDWPAIAEQYAQFFSQLVGTDRAVGLVGVETANEESSWQAPLDACPSISAVVITRNEADVLDMCLQSLSSWVDELVVVDMDSTDASRDIARRHGARVTSHLPIDDAGPARNFAFDQTHSDWILWLDPDERVPSALAVELRRLSRQPTIDVVEVPRQQVQFGRTVHSPGASDGSHPRLFRRGVVSWPSHMHGLPDLQGLRVHRIPRRPEMCIEHHTWRSVPIVLDKIMRYAPRDVEHMRATGKRFSLLGMVRAVHAQVAGRFVDGRAYEDGMAGLLTALFFGVYHFVIYAELWEADGKPAQSDATVVQWGRRTARVYNVARGGYRVARFVRRLGAP